MAVTLKDLSRETGINLCSVSQVLNDHPRAQTLRQETREKILAAAKRLGYNKNQMAASIGKKHSRVLAFVHSDMGTVEYMGRIQNGVIKAANARGYTLTVHHIGDSPEKLIHKLLGWRVAGVIFHIFQLEQLAPFVKLLEQENIPYGTVNLSNPGGIGVTTDDAAGIRSAVRHLRESGHKKVAYVYTGEKTELLEIEFKQRRFSGFEDGMREYYPEVKKPLSLSFDYSRAQDLKYMTSILQSLLKKNVDGVICESDALAVALNNIAIYNGCRVPERFSLIGFGGSMISEVSFPMLSTITQDFEKMGMITTNSIIDSMEGKNNSSVEGNLLPVSLLVRESVAERIKVIRKGVK